LNRLPYVIDESALRQGSEVWFTLPPGFVPLPLHELKEAAQRPTEAGGQEGALRPLLEAAGPSARERLLKGLGPALRMAQLLVEAGAVHCCLGLHTDDERGGLLLSLFTLSWRATDWAPRSVLAARAAAGVENASHIETFELPCGPGALVETWLRGPADAGLAAYQLAQVTVYVPCPDGRRLALLTLATTEVEHAPAYRALMRGIAYSTSFDNPLPDILDED
jgi:hypothetical protein